MHRFFLCLSLFLLASCAQRWPDPVTLDGASEAPVARKSGQPITQAQIDQMTGVCYDQLQKSIGETRPHRGLIWAECKQQYVMPLEQKLYPKKQQEIAQMYDALIADMKGWYAGATTWELLEQRWQRRQRAIGMRYIETFHDTMIPM